MNKKETDEIVVNNDIKQRMIYNNKKNKGNWDQGQHSLRTSSLSQIIECWKGNIYLKRNVIFVQNKEIVSEMHYAILF